MDCKPQHNRSRRKEWPVGIWASSAIGNGEKGTSCLLVLDWKTGTPSGLAQGIFGGLIHVAGMAFKTGGLRNDVKIQLGN